LLPRIGVFAVLPIAFSKIEGVRGHALQPVTLNQRRQLAALNQAEAAQTEQERLRPERLRRELQLLRFRLCSQGDWGLTACFELLQRVHAVFSLALHMRPISNRARLSWSVNFALYP